MRGPLPEEALQIDIEHTPKLHVLGQAHLGSGLLLAQGRDDGSCVTQVPGGGGRQQRLAAAEPLEAPAVPLGPLAGMWSLRVTCPADSWFKGLRRSWAERLI